MKKVFMLAALLCCTLSGFAEEKPIKIEKDGEPDPRSLIQLPTASIDGQVLAISFVTNCRFEVSVVDQSGVVVYTGVYSAQGAIITLPNLTDNAGSYTVEIVTEYGECFTGSFRL